VTSAYYLKSQHGLDLPGRGYKVYVTLAPRAVAVPATKYSFRCPVLSPDALAHPHRIRVLSKFGYPFPRIQTIPSPVRQPENFPKLVANRKQPRERIGFIVTYAR